MIRHLQTAFENPGKQTLKSVPDIDRRSIASTTRFGMTNVLQVMFLTDRTCLLTVVLNMTKHSIAETIGEVSDR